MQLTFVVTNRCTALCEFCAPNCSPSAKGELDAVFMKRIIDEARVAFNLGVVVFTGGEPMMCRQSVIESLRHVKATVGCDARIVTNGFWATSAVAAAKVVNELKDAGLTELNISVDDFHQKFVPIERVRYGALAARDAGLTVLLAHKTFPNSVATKAFYEEHLGCSLHDPDVSHPPQAGSILFSTGITLPIGRGAERIDQKQWRAEYSKSYDASRWKGPCREVLKAISIHYNRRLSPCCGLVARDIPEFYFGDLDVHSLVDVIDAASNSTLYNWLGLEGPSGIIDRIAQKDPSLSFPENYAQNCEACQAIFSDSKARKAVRESLGELTTVLTLKRALHEAVRSISASEVV